MDLEKDARIRAEMAAGDVAGEMSELGEAAAVAKVELVKLARAVASAKESDRAARRVAKRTAWREKRSRRRLVAREMSARKVAKARAAKVKRKRTRR